MRICHSLPADRERCPDCKHPWPEHENDGAMTVAKVHGRSYYSWPNCPGHEGSPTMKATEAEAETFNRVRLHKLGYYLERRSLQRPDGRWSNSYLIVGEDGRVADRSGRRSGGPFGRGCSIWTVSVDVTDMEVERGDMSLGPNI